MPVLEEGTSQGLKPGFVVGLNARAEALAYLEATATTTATTRTTKSRSGFPSGMTTRKARATKKIGAAVAAAIGFEATEGKA